MPVEMRCVLIAAFERDIGYSLVAVSEQAAGLVDTRQSHHAHEGLPGRGPYELAECRRRHLKRGRDFGLADDPPKMIVDVALHSVESIDQVAIDNDIMCIIFARELLSSLPGKQIQNFRQLDDASNTRQTYQFSQMTPNEIRCFRMKK